MEGWTENFGGMPVIPSHTLVDVLFADGDVVEDRAANYWIWHRIGAPSDITHWRLHNRDAGVVRVPEVDTNGLKSWGGGERPVSADTIVEYEMRDGGVCEDLAGDLRWDHRMGSGDIVAYKVVSEAALKLSVPYAPNMFIEVPEVEQKPDVKDTNPKDMVGTRKAPLSTVPMNVIAEVGVAMLEGAAKYGRHNYRAVGVRASVYFDATMRHLLSWWEYEDIDPDSQINHITKAITSLVVLRDAMMQGKCTDDRPPRSKPFYEALNGLAGKIIDKHSDKAPKHYTIEEV